MTIKDPYTFLFTANHKTVMNESGKRYDPSLCADFAQYRKDGLSLTECAAMFDVTVRTLRHWKKEHPEFKEAWDRAETYHDAYWMALGREALAKRDKDFDAKLWYMNMKNRMGWSDKINQQTTLEGNLNTSIAAQIAAANDHRKALEHDNADDE